MKFGKRLHREAVCRWPEAFVDYKALKQAIKADVVDAGRDKTDPDAFHRLLLGELDRTSTFYSAIESQLMSRCEAAQALRGTAQVPGSHAALRRDALELRRAAVLNQMAVAKAVKKARRRLAGRAPAVEALDVVVLLAGRSFFSSPRVAHLLTALDVEAAAGGLAAGALASTSSAGSGSLPTTSPADAAADFTCPICLDILRGPVVLTCAHRVCWSCLLAHAEHSARFGLEHAGARGAGDGTVKGIMTEGQSSTGESGSDEAGGSFAASGQQARRLPPARISPIPLSVDGGCMTPASCPVCRQQQLLNLDRLRIDPVLEAFVEALRREGSGHRPAEPGSPGSQGSSTDQSEAPLHSPRQPNKLTLCLDLDGTLVTTFSPARAPILPRGIQAYTVGAGSRLNPAGVVVVERPGLGEFLRRASRCAELVLFTAGLEEYAAPIADALEARYEKFAHRLYRPATVPGPDYPCVKDLSRLGRPLGRTMLADDTPLAFSAQPDNGIPVHAFRGDVDDRLLTEALAPLVESLVGAVDVRSVLHARFAMRSWFAAQKIASGSGGPGGGGDGATGAATRRPARTGKVSSAASRAVARASASASHRPPPSPLHKSASSTAMMLGPDSPRAAWRPRASRGAMGAVAMPASQATASSLTGYDTEEDDRGIVPPPALVGKLGTLLVMDFDQTLIHVDAGHWLAEALVPELASLLDVPDPRESWVPATNAVWREAARRGVDARAIAGAMHALAKEVPAESPALLRWAAREAGWACALLSDCNTLVIAGVLEALGATLDVDAVITNPARWTPEGALHVEPRHAEKYAAEHRHRHHHQHAAGMGHSQAPPPSRGAPCGHCPSNLCKGAELDAVVAARCAAPPSPFASAGTAPRHERVIYVGDGTNDLCPALRLEAHDVVLARKGYPLDGLLDEHASRISAQVHHWTDHAELLRIIKSLGA